MSAVDQAAPELGVGTISTDRHPVVRYRAGWDCGDTFGAYSNYDGLALTIEVADAADAQAMLEAIARRADLAAPSAPAEVEGLVERFDIYLDDFDHLTKMPSSDGEWMRHADHATALTALQAENERLRENTNRFPELMASILAAKAQGLPERIAAIADAISALPEDFGRHQWKADDRPVFGDKFVRHVAGDNGQGTGRQWIASTPPHIDGLAQYIAAANPDSVSALIADYAAQKARAEKAEAERDAWKANAEALDGAVAALLTSAHDYQSGIEEGLESRAAHAKLKGDV